MKAASDWISVLEASGQLVLLEPWFENLGKRAIKTPKVLIRDPGLLCFLLGLGEDTLIGSPLRGPVWETFALAEIRKLNAASSHPGRLWFYRDQGGREVDLLLERGGVLDLIEVKWSENPADSDVGMLDAVGRALSAHSPTTRLGRKWLVCRTPVPHTRADGTRIITPLQLGELFRA